MNYAVYLKSLAICVEPKMLCSGLGTNNVYCCKHTLKFSYDT